MLAKMSRIAPLAPTSSTHRALVLPVMVTLLALAGCTKTHGELVVDDTVGVTALRSPCPLVEIPEMTGDMTMFAGDRINPGENSGAIDTVAAITHLRSTCNAAAQLPELTTKVNFEVLARRTDTHGARHIDLPYFTVVQRGGTNIVAKHVATIGIDFADGRSG